MIGYLHGKVARLGTDYCIVDVQGVGYRLTIPASTREELRLGEMTTLETYLQVREDALTLYGFAYEAEYELFTLLITVSGVGPKVACGVVSAVTPAAFYAAIRGGQKAVLTGLPGIGKKTAERLILELKDKVAALPAGDETVIAPPVAAETGTGAVAETVRALVGLGYTEREVEPVAARLAAEYAETEALLRAVLAALGKERRR